MKIQGTIHTTQVVKSEIDPLDLLEALEKEIKESFRVPCDAYINNKNEWETQTDTHGSGLYETVRDAFLEERGIMDSFAAIRKKLKELK